MKRKCLYCLVLLSVPCGLGACATTESSDPLAVAAAPVAATALAEPSMVEPQASDAVYTYNAIGKRDPFRDMFRELDPDDRRQKRQPLERYDLDQLKLVAVVVGTAAPRAMIEDPAGVGHIVRIGTLVGKHSGQVQHIRRAGVVVREEFRTYTGERVAHLITLRLPVEQVEEL